MIGLNALEFRPQLLPLLTERLYGAVLLRMDGPQRGRQGADLLQLADVKKFTIYTSGLC